MCFLRAEYFKTELNTSATVQKITIKGNQIHKTIKLFLKLCVETYPPVHFV